MMAEVLELWLREEMELPPSAIPSPAALRRLCSGPAAPIWDYVIRHVWNQRNVKKIRGNLHLYWHLQELETPRWRWRRAGGGWSFSEGRSFSCWGRSRARLGCGTATRGRCGQSVKGWANPGTSCQPSWLWGQSRKCWCQSRPCARKAREAELQRPRPCTAANHPGKAQEAPDWSEQAEAVLIGHSPEAVLWALEVLANQSTRALLAGPAPSAEALPTLKSLLQL
ncbi:uncharacterized protein LOC134423491 isoform X2 [Melospiza melodia melodia]|uniref:uncharacterized protein LOC134423491 isoform X2 n=1 Tax=Melospiza melodia melodia TaxID=1914991 RepID=UPI002FD71466